MTVVFSDLVGSTELGERLDPETLRDALNRYFEAARVAVERHGGLIEKFIGDAVMAVFGLPAVHEDDALRAVRAAHAMQAALLSVNEELERDFGVRLRTRTGVNTGEVVTGDPSAGQRFVTGDAVNVAARLEQAADPDTIVVGEDTYSLVRHSVETERLPPFDLKGKAESISAHRLLALKESEAAVDLSTGASFVGRENELTQLQGVLLQARSAQLARLITIVGEAGIGKSRLAEEALQVSDRAALTLRGRCLPYGDGITYWPIVQVLRSIGGVGEDDDVDLGRNLREATPEPLDDLVIASLVSLVTGSEAYPVEEVTRSFRRYVEALAVVRPVVLLFEDVHWAEPTLLDLVEHLARAAARLSVLCTARPELLDLRPGWAGASIVIALKPLAPDEAGRMITEFAGSGVAVALQKQLLEAAGGNPFFVEQIVSMLEEQGALRPVGGARSQAEPAAITLPPSVAAVLDARLDQLPTAVQDVAERAAIVGKIFYRRAVEALGGPAESVDEHLAELIARGFVEPQATDLPGEEAFAFRHILIRDAVYRGTLKRRRAGWHERLGEWFERRSAGHGGAEEIVGYHLEQAHRLRVELGLQDERTSQIAARASAVLAVGGRRASDRGDAPAAAVLFTRALAMASDEPTRVQLMVDLGIAQLESGRASEAVSTTRSAFAGARSTGDSDLALRARVAGITVALHADIVDQTSLIAESKRIVEQLRFMGDLEAVVDATTTIGILEFSIGQMSASADRLQEAATLAREIDDGTREYRALDWLSIAVAYGPMPVSNAREACEAIIRSTRHRSRVEASARASLAVLQAMSLEIEEARANMTLSRAIYEELGMVMETAAVSQALGLVELLSGDPARAEAELLRDREVLEEMGGHGYLASTELCLALVLDALGRHDEARDVMERMDPLILADDVVGRAEVASVKVRVLLSKRWYQEAEDEARGAIRGGRSTDRYDVLPNALVDLADVLVATGRAEEAVELLHQARTLHLAKENAASLAKVDGRLTGLGHSTE